MNIQEIVTDIKSKYPNINNVFFVGCGAVSYTHLTLPTTERV